MSSSSCMLLSTISSVSPADRSSSRILPEPVAATSLKLRSMAGVGIVFQFLWWRMRLDWHRVAVYDCARFAGVAQLVEQRIRNAQVMGSSPFTGSRHSPSFFFTPPFGGVFLCLASRSVSVVCRCSYFRCLPHHCSRSKSAKFKNRGQSDCPP